MSEYRLGVIEGRFADLVWENEPITAAELAKKCEGVFHWKKTTAYTVLKRLIGKGYLKNEDATVTALVPREEVQEADGKGRGDLPDLPAGFLFQPEPGICGFQLRRRPALVPGGVHRQEKADGPGGCRIAEIRG